MDIHDFPSPQHPSQPPTAFFLFSLGFMANYEASDLYKAGKESEVKYFLSG